MTLMPPAPAEPPPISIDTAYTPPGTTRIPVTIAYETPRHIRHAATGHMRDADPTGLRLPASEVRSASTTPVRLSLGPLGRQFPLTERVVTGSSIVPERRVGPQTYAGPGRQAPAGPRELVTHEFLRTPVRVLRRSAWDRGWAVALSTPNVDG